MDLMNFFTARSELASAKLTNRQGAVNAKEGSRQQTFSVKKPIFTAIAGYSHLDLPPAWRMIARTIASGKVARRKKKKYAP